MSISGYAPSGERSEDTTGACGEVMRQRFSNFDVRDDIFVQGEVSGGGSCECRSG